MARKAPSGEKATTRTAPFVPLRLAGDEPFFGLRHAATGHLWFARDVPDPLGDSHRRSCSALGWSPDGHTLATGGHNGWVCRHPFSGGTVTCRQLTVLYD